MAEKNRDAEGEFQVYNTIQVANRVLAQAQYCATHKLAKSIQCILSYVLSFWRQLKIQRPQTVGIFHRMNLFTRKHIRRAIYQFTKMTNKWRSKMFTMESTIPIHLALSAPHKKLKSTSNDHAFLLFVRCHFEITRTLVMLLWATEMRIYSLNRAQWRSQPVFHWVYLPLTSES